MNSHPLEKCSSGCRLFGGCLFNAQGALRGLCGYCVFDDIDGIVEYWCLMQFVASILLLGRGWVQCRACSAWILLYRLSFVLFMISSVGTSVFLNRCVYTAGVQVCTCCVA